VAGFGAAIEAPINATAATQCAARRKGGGAEQSNTVKVIFFVNTNGFVELVILTPFLTNFKALPAGNTRVAPFEIKSNILTSC